ncbi:hypothetical protein DGG96_15175 [Legionella qingyii]|uniref:Uncharacterized protein n=1 Tax=Legionella qingyii TaxID=2184757 RepID=A0A317U208_9GAMM|nr:hypothetical protein DGG96_15175 [Legionella qingyii]
MSHFPFFPRGEGARGADDPKFFSHIQAKFLLLLELKAKKLKNLSTGSSILGILFPALERAT